MRDKASTHRVKCCIEVTSLIYSHYIKEKLSLTVCNNLKEFDILLPPMTFEKNE